MIADEPLWRDTLPAGSPARFAVYAAVMGGLLGAVLMAGRRRSYA